ncbi:hypoxia induced protein conserved region-domain-containing protein [Aspergillus karnatakaensis]|uniref:respiratory supercomplex assembly factor RCF1 n=1 Tax=Aspergillus karnatakaensis TaxID=1810916 RepID=UPI003CCE516A
MSSDPLPSSFEGNDQFEEETPLQKFRRRFTEEPWVPVGCAATCYALYRAYRSMKAGDSVEMNRMFRWRIYAQAFTLITVVAGGVYYKAERTQRREFEQALELKRGQEKRDAWLRELEIRDKEDKEWRERHAAIEAAAKEASKKPASPEQDAARSALEPADEKSIGVLNAVRDLMSRRG